ncbi:type IV pilin-like G/H family protein [Oscillatoria sp. FACHB-1406]|uniref:protein kinase domain-containing protein n=1 Tax=Oscillatoria sp. FACHB-1406 TaxID=2692846 RepID=UPI001685BA31|nr:type IV pilin-like G/H family protein [Oscillatoria sp. FACHB-1406]MBD2578208.1 protein kinase [Oscillatoria sp. FACHB-1406]
MLKSQQILQERYQLKEQLSQNPTRQTWRAEDTQSHQDVIVKLLPFSPQTQWQDVKLFEREAQILKHLNFAKIPRYLDYFSVEKELGDGLPWFALVQNYIPGSSLQKLLKNGETFGEAEVKNIARQLLGILIYLHELSPPVLHRDIKPSNIIQGQDGKIHLVDFGAVQDKAKAEGVTFTVVGTGGYAPPEQLWGRAVAASDLYALGATLIHLVTGVSPGELSQHRMRLQFRDKVNLSPEFAAWLDKLIAPAVEQRYESAREALAALQATERDAKRAKVHYGRLGRLALLQYGTVGLCLLVLPLFGVYRYITEGRTYVGSMNRAQQAYFLENNEFAESLEKLGIGIPPSTKNYQYQTVRTPLFAINYALPRQRKFKGYVGIVFSDKRQGELTTDTFLCEDSTVEANTFKQRMMALPWIENGVIRCPIGTINLGGGREIVPSGEGFKLAYQALDEATSQSEDKGSMLTLAKISDPDIKARAFETIVPYLKTGEDLERAISGIGTIKDVNAKARISIALARQIIEDKSTFSKDIRKSFGLPKLSPNLKIGDQFDDPRAEKQYYEALRLLTDRLQDKAARSQAIQAIEQAKRDR